jgi:hypothetical protein
MNVALRSLQDAIGNLARGLGFPEARVQSKVNTHGEYLIGLILPPRGFWPGPVPMSPSALVPSVAVPPDPARFHKVPQAPGVAFSAKKA